MPNHIERIVDVVVRGLDVLDSKENLIGWLKSPCIALGGKTPLSLLDSEDGVRQVLVILGRVESGVYS